MSYLFTGACPIYLLFLPHTLVIPATAGIYGFDFVLVTAAVRGKMFFFLKKEPKIQAQLTGCFAIPPVASKDSVFWGSNTILHVDSIYDTIGHD